MKERSGLTVRMADDLRIEELRNGLLHGQGISQEELDRVTARLGSAKEKLRPHDKIEPLPLLNSQGQHLGTTAPRWICHLLGLRHRCAHILLIWNSPALGDVAVLQIRDWSKDDSPGYVDISVGGHMTSTEVDSAQDAPFTEMLEETGLAPSDLEGPLQYLGGYPFDEARPDETLYNSEWREVYIGRLKQDSFTKVCFPDGEVAAVVLVPLSTAWKLLRQNTIPMASALINSLPRCLEHMGEVVREQAAPPDVDKPRR